MPQIETLADLYKRAGHDFPPILPARAQSTPFTAGSSGRRAQDWVTSRLGVSTLLWGNLEQIRSRCRDEIRNNPWASSAIDNFESQTIGNGIRPQWQLEDPDLNREIHAAWNHWIYECDAFGQSSFYGLEALGAREIFEAGEVFARFHVRPKAWGLRIPLQLELIEGEQLPVFRNVAPDTPATNSIRNGIEFDPWGRRVAYHMYKEHPGETMFYPLEGLTFQRIPASEILHVYKPVRTKQLRGQPALTSVLTLLHQLEQFTDYELLRKIVSSAFAAFIEKPGPDGSVLPPDPNAGLNAAGQSVQQDPGTAKTKIEPGMMTELYPGEKITFPTVPDSPDFEAFLNVQLHKFCAGIGMTFEQVTTDLRGVNYSSIRAGLLDFRRKCEQFQRNTIVFGMCQPIMRRWLKEAVLAGVLDLPGYSDDPAKYENVRWISPGWRWVDPEKEFQAYEGAVRAGFTSRAHVVAEQGHESADIDEEQAKDNARADALGLSYDSDGRKVMTGRNAGLTEGEIEQDATEVAPEIPGARQGVKK